MFAIAVIVGVTVVTGAAVATYFSKSTSIAAEPAPEIVADKQAAPEIVTDKQAAPEIATDEQPAPQLPTGDKPVMTASLEPAFPPVHKVVIKTFPALKAGQLRAPKPIAASTAVEPVAAATAPNPEPEPAAPRASDGPVVASVDAFDELEEQDPRWAINEADAGRSEFLTAIPPAASSGKSGSSTDGTETAAIESEQIKPKRASAAAGDDTSAAQTAVAGATRSVQVNKGVNMRSRGRSGSSVIMTIPRSATVQVVGCKAWCEVIYKGRRGFIYKSFVGGGGSKRSASRSKQPTVAAAPKDDAKTVFVVDSAEKTESPETTGGTSATPTTEKPATPKPKIIVQRER
jgi:uncharacterized protein YraI